MAEAWRKRRYPAAFVSKLSDAETEACETQVWLEFSTACGYMEESETSALHKQYDRVLGQLVKMAESPDKWTR
ncbi:MAG: four helix bundle protein [Lentisphaerae bacterium]|nr:four helix bundle protein [Lentisphaerota bacterium]